MKYFRHRPFELGRIVVSAELTAALDLTEITEALLRHSRGDWGEVSHDDCEANEDALIRGGRVWSMALVDRYTKSFRLTDLRVIERGPDLTIPEMAPSLQKTGTDNIEAEKTLSPSLSPDPGFQETSSDPAGLSSGRPRLRGASSNRQEKAEKTHVLTGFPPVDIIDEHSRRSGRAVDCAGLENRLA